MSSGPDIIEIIDIGTQGPSGINWRDDINGGEWLIGTTYSLRDGVYHDGTSYRALATHTASAANEPGVGASWETYWNVIALGANEAQVQVVVDNIVKITTVADNIGDVGTVADNIADIGTVADDIAAVKTVSTSISSVNSVAAALPEIQAVEADLANIDAVAGDLPNINTVATNITKVDTVSTNIAKVTTVADNITPVGTVASNISQVQTVATNITSVQTTATISMQIQIVADPGYSVHVVNVSNNMSAVMNASNNMAAIIAAPGAAAAAAGSAGAAATSATLSQAWAEGTLPGGAGTKSAKEWATAAQVAKITWRPGGYNAGTAYAQSDAVQYGGSAWIAKGATTGNVPPTLPTTSNTYWDLLVQKGDVYLEFDAPIYKATNIDLGGYYVYRSTPAQCTITSIYGEILAGDPGAQVDFYVSVNGSMVAGPYSVILGTPVNQTALNIVVAKGSTVTYVITYMIGNVTDLVFQGYGPAS